MNENGLTALHTSFATSTKWKSAIDFGIGRRTIYWQVARIQEGTSDHYSVLFLSPFSAEENRISRKTNWKMFTFFLRVTHPYLSALVDKIEFNAYFDIFSSFIASLCDRCSVYESNKNSRASWPPYLGKLTETVNKSKRKFRRTRFLDDYHNFKDIHSNYIREKIAHEQNKRPLRLKRI